MSSCRIPGTLYRMAWLDCHCYIRERCLIRITVSFGGKIIYACQVDSAFPGRSGAGVDGEEMGLTAMGSWHLLMNRVSHKNAGRVFNLPPPPEC